MRDKVRWSLGTCWVKRATQAADRARKLSCGDDAIKLLRRQRQERGDYPSPGRGRQCRTKHQAGFESKKQQG